MATRYQRCNQKLPKVYSEDTKGVIRRYQRCNQKPPIEEEQRIQWPQDTKGVIRSHQSKKDRKYNGHKIPKV
jgi:hypothetical protein